MARGISSFILYHGVREMICYRFSLEWPEWKQWFRWIFFNSSLASLLSGDLSTQVKSCCLWQNECRIEFIDCCMQCSWMGMKKMSFVLWLMIFVLFVITDVDFVVLAIVQKYNFLFFLQHKVLLCNHTLPFGGAQPPTSLI